MRQHVTVALSGDGGDEALAGTRLREIPAIRFRQLLPAPVAMGASVLLRRLEDLAISPARLSQRLVQLSNSDNTSIIQNLLCWVRGDEHQRLCGGLPALPVRRLFEPGWEHQLPSHVSRLERLSAHATEVYGRLLLPNDFLFKVDTASMRESLEVRVPLFDEGLFAFGLSLPHVLKARIETGNGVRGIAKKWLPPSVATRPKQGFRIPIDRWVTPAFKARLRETLLGRSTRLPDFFHIDSYRPIVEAFCDQRAAPGISRQGCINGP